MSCKLKGISIGLDFDGVIINHAPNRMLLAKRFGFILPIEHTTADIIGKKIPFKFHRAIQKLIYDDPKIALTAPLIKGAKENIQKLKEAGAMIHIISQRRNRDLAINILRKHNLWPNYFSEKNTAFVESKEEKDVQAKNFEISIYLDDEIDVLDKLKSVSNRFLFDPFNFRKKGDWYCNVNSWDNFLTTLDERGFF